MDQHRSAEADDELRQEQLEDEHDLESGSFGEFLRAHWIWASVAALVLIAAVAAGIIWWLHARHFEWTDDAFIDLRQFAVSSKVPGCIRDVDVTDNRKVAAGDVLVQIDDRDYRTSLAQSEARLSEAVGKRQQCRSADCSKASAGDGGRATANRGRSGAAICQTRV